MTVYSQQSLIKVGRGQRNLFNQIAKQKKRKLEFFVSWKQWFPAVMNDQSPNSGFIEISLLHSEHSSTVKNRRVKIVLKTLAAHAICCFILISRKIDEAKWMQSLMEVGRSLRNFLPVRFQNKKEKMEIFCFLEEMVSSSYEQSKSKQRFYWNFAFAFRTLFDCEK